MSGSQWNALNLTPYDPIKIPSAMAGLAQQQAQTQGENIKNAMAGLQLGKQNMLYGAFGIGPGATPGGAPVTQQAMPWSGAGPGAGGAVPPSGSAVGLTAPPANDGPGGSPGGGPGVIGGQNLSEPGEMGLRFFGTPMPPLMALAAGDSTNPNAMKDALEARRQATYSIMNVPDSQWNSAVRRAYDSGYITADTARNTYGRPELREKVLAAYATPDAHSALIGTLARNGVQQSGQTGQLVPDAGLINAKGAIAGAEAGATLPYKIAEHRANAIFDTGELNTRDWNTVGPGAARAAIDARAKADYETPVTIHVYDKTINGGKGGYRDQTIRRADLPNLSADGSVISEAARQNPGVSVTPEAYASRVINGESGGVYDATNPRSSAGGGGQFIRETWLSTVKDIAPELVRGMSDDQIAALRFDKSPRGVALQQAATAAYGQENAPKLASAGLPVSTYTLALAHQFGPGDVGKVLNAAPSTPMSKLFPANPDGTENAVMKANPQFKRQTVGDVRGLAFNRYGNNSVAFGPSGGAPAGAEPGPAATPVAPAPQPVGPAAPAAPAAPPAAGPAAPAPAAVAAAPPVAPPGGAPVPAAPAMPGIPGLPVYTPAETAAVATNKSLFEKDAKDINETVDHVRAASAGQTQLMQIRALAPAATTGAFAEQRQTVQSLLKTFAPDVVQRAAASMSAGFIDPSKASSTQELVKSTLMLSGAAERETLGARGGLGAIQLYQRAYPSIGSQETAIRDMSNVILIADQRIKDYGEGAVAHFNAASDAYKSDPRQYTQLSHYDDAYLAKNSPAVYAAAAAWMNDKPQSEWSSGLKSRDEMMEAARIVWRADPGAILKFDGKPFKNPAMAAPR